MACTAAQRERGTLPAHGIEYRGGLWFNGSTFVAKTMYVAGGLFHARKPVHVDSVLQVHTSCPPFGDEHQHLVDPRIDQTIRSQLRDGVFYIKDQANSPVLRRIIDPQLNKPELFDYITPCATSREHGR